MVAGGTIDMDEYGVRIEALREISRICLRMNTILNFQYQKRRTQLTVRSHHSRKKYRLIQVYEKTDGLKW